MFKKCKYLILGGGVSGLTFANFIKSDDYLILEKESELGGYCRTIYQEGYIWDYAGHFFHFATEEMKGFFSDRIPPEDLIKKTKCTRIFYKDIIIDFPFQANIHQLDKEEFIECLYDLYFRTKKEGDVYKSFLDMLYGKFGISITEKFLKPYNEKLYACDLNTLDQDAMGRFFPYADLEQVISNFRNTYGGSYNAQFMYPQKGAKVFVDALAKDIDSNKIYLNERVSFIDGEQCFIETTSGKRIYYEYLINSSSLNTFLDSLRGVKYTNIEKCLSWNKVLVFNLGFEHKSQYTDIHWAYVPDRDINFYRVGFYDNILGESKLSMYVEIGLASSDDVNEEEQLALTLANLRKLGIIDKDNKLISFSVIMMDPAYVHVNSKLDELKTSLKIDLKSKNIYTIGRYGDWKYCSIEDSMMDAVRIANELNGDSQRIVGEI